MSAEGIIQPETAYEGKAQEKKVTGEIYFVLLSENGLDVLPDQKFTLEGNGICLADKTDNNGEFRYSPAEFGDYELKVDAGIFCIPAVDTGSLPYEVPVPYVLLPTECRWEGPTEEQTEEPVEEDAVVEEPYLLKLTGERISPRDFVWVSQLEERKNEEGEIVYRFANPAIACFDACKAMVEPYGELDRSAGRSIVVTTNKNSNGNLVQDADFRENAETAKAYIDEQLEENHRPVIVHVSPSPPTEPRREHWVVIFQKQTNDQGETVYKLKDPGTKHKNKSEGEFKIDQSSSLLYKPENPAYSGYVYGKRYELFEVRRYVE